MVYSPQLRLKIVFIKLILLSSENVSTINNIYNSLWSSINTQQNGTDISDPSSKWYACKAHFEKLLSFSTATKATLNQNDTFKMKLVNMILLIMHQQLILLIIWGKFQEMLCLRKVNGFTFATIYMLILQYWEKWVLQMWKLPWLYKEMLSSHFKKFPSWGRGGSSPLGNFSQVTSLFDLEVYLATIYPVCWE